MKNKKEDRKKPLNINSIFTDTTSTLTNVKDTIDSEILQKDYWIKRLSAVAVDYFMLFIISGIIWPTAHFFEFMVYAGLLSVLYFTITESFFGYSIGKKIFGLEVTNYFGTKTSLKNSFIRNVSKINIILLVLDMIMGHFTSSGNKKYLDKITGTSVDILTRTEFTFSEATGVEATH